VTGPEPVTGISGPRLSVAVVSGATATIANTPPLVTGDQARRRHGLPPAPYAGAAAVRPQRLAAPVRVQLEAFSAHPLERDAEELYAPADGYLGPDGTVSPVRRSLEDRPVYEALLSPEDGLCLLPYMAGQTFFPDVSRLFEEVDRFGLDGSSTPTERPVSP
jgi:L-asparaginase